MAPETRTLLRDIIVAVLLALLICIAGVAWIDYDVPGAWPDLIGPSDWGEGGSYQVGKAFRGLSEDATPP